MKKAINKSVAYLLVFSMATSGVVMQLGNDTVSDGIGSSVVNNYGENADSVINKDGSSDVSTSNVKNSTDGNGISDSGDELNDDGNAVNSSTINAGSIAKGASNAAIDTNSQNTVVTKAIESEIKYFPVTMYNYYAPTFNKATNKLEIQNGELSDKWQGFYFNDGYENVNDGIVQVDLFDDNGNLTLEDGKYIIYSVTAARPVVVSKTETYTTTGAYRLGESANYGTATEWTIKKQADGTYTIQDINGDYMYISWDQSGEAEANDGYATVKDTASYFNIAAHDNGDGTGTENAIEISLPSTTAQAYGKCWLNDHGGRNEFSSWYQPSANNAFYLYKVDSSIYETEVTEPTFNENNYAEIEDGYYVIYGHRAGFFINSGISEAEDDYGQTIIIDSESGDLSDLSNTTIWTIKNVGDGAYTIQDDKGRYINISANGQKARLSDTVTECYLGNYNELKLDGNVAVDNAVTIEHNGFSMNDYGGTAILSNYYQGTADIDYGNSFVLYKVDKSAQEGIGLLYDAWNHYTNRATLWDGIVEDTLDANKNIQFKHIEAGVFDNNTEVKDIYTNVEMPFIYEYIDTDNNGKSSWTYTFDSEIMSARFDGNPQSNVKLGAYDAQIMASGITSWFPFNEETNIQTADYHFGMTATIPFTMTANGRINPLDDESEPIRFEFSGDDDIWIFIDGQLVLDLGGIHDRVGAELDFSTNTWKLVPYNEEDKYQPQYTTADKALSGTIFNVQEENGVINQTLESFSSTETHELTIFYLERGEGESNCKISFNLPMKDYVSVTKKADRSYTLENGNQVITALTASEKEQVNNISFGFTLYKRNTDDNGNVTDVPVANTSYNLTNENGQILDNPSTDASGHFYLKNGQTARFMTEIEADSGNTYYVVEDAIDGFSQTRYSYAGEADGGFRVTDSEITYNYATSIEATDFIPNVNDANNPIKSDEITVIGNENTNDSLQFICENFYDASMPNGTLYPQEDVIVIDYGLGVKIKPLDNDVWRGDSIQITDITGAEYGVATIEGDNVIDYKLQKQLSAVETLTYTAKVTADGTSGEGVTGTIYIIPATSMYYEENFAEFEEEPLVTYNNGKSAGEKADGTWSYGWMSELGAGIAVEYQEPGVVGTIGDSPYGSDVAYLSDSRDSNESSMYVDTTLGAAQFTYSFTGTGTAFFARTSDTTAYLKIDLTKSDGTNVDSRYRNTVYRVDGSVLYNIPVYNIENLEYGTYNVSVIVAKKSDKLKLGGDFWLDGIRVYNPLGTNLTGSTDLEKAYSAYATDGEANNTVVTLRDKLLNDVTTTNENGELIWSGADKNDNNFVLFTDSHDQMVSASDYQSYGPKEEVYLNDGQSISFSLANWDANSHTVYLGIKAPKGTGTVVINGTSMDINNATDCYYQINPSVVDRNGVKYGNFVITAGAGDLISLTNIKITGKANEFVIKEQLRPELADWSTIEYLNGTTEQQYKAMIVRGNVSQIVNIQNTLEDEEYGIYFYFSDAQIGNITVNGNEMKGFVAGSGIRAYLSNFTERYNTIVVYNPDGSEKAVLYVYNSKAEA